MVKKKTVRQLTKPASTLPKGWVECKGPEGRPVYIKVSHVQGVWLASNGLTTFVMDGGAGLQVQESFYEVMKGA
jgi:hypothetical protein